DADAGDTRTYSLDAASDKVFDIDASTGAVTVQVESGSALDFEAAPSVTATVTATDSHGATATHDVAIGVNDRDEPPDAPAAPTVAGASSTSVDASWTAPANAGRPAISGYDVQFRASGASSWTAHAFSGAGTSTTIPGLSPGTTYEVQVKAKNAEGDSGWSAAGSGATDANSAPVFTNQPTTANVDENSADGAAVQTGSPAAALVVAATDADAGDTRTYSLDTESDKVFDIDASTGAVTVQVESGSALDFEAAPSVTATVTATDSHGATATHDVAIGVNDRDEPPDAPAAPTVAGASPTSVTVGWTAPDNTGKPAISDYDVRFKLASASAWTPHVFTGAGTGTTIPGLTENTSYDVQVMAKNDEGSSAWSAAGSGSTNANNAPVFTGQPAAATVTENSADGTAVVAVTATEPDAGDSVRYTLDAASDNLFAIDSSSGAITVQVESGSALDHEAAPSITATVTATDTSNATATHRVAIAVADEDEPPDAPGEPAVAGASSTSVDVGWTAPANAGKPPVSDYDVQFRVSGATNWTAHGFTGTGTGTTISGLSPGTAYQVQVKAHNAEGPSGWSAAGRGATDANSPPVFSGQPATATVRENSADGTAVQTGSPAVALAVTAEESDAGDSVAYSLDPTSDSVFDIDASTGAVTVRVEDGSALDHEAAPTITATVTATDSHGGTATHDVAIGVADEDEPPAAPAAPAVSTLPAGEQARPVAVRAAWTAPDAAGIPPITGYEVEYKESAATAWTSHAHAGTGVSTTIGSLADRLEPSTRYDVRVKAVNAEGESGWSDAGSGSTAPPDTTGPGFASATVNRTALEVVFDENLDPGSVPGTGVFRVTVDGGLTTFAGTLSIAGATVSGTLESGAAHGAAVTVAYTRRDGDTVLEDPFGNEVESFSAQSVTNNTPAGSDVRAPRFASGTVNGTSLEVVYDENLDSNSRPAGSAFAVDFRVGTPNEERIEGTGTVSISGSAVAVTLAKAAPPGEAFVVYNVPASNPLQDAAGNQVLTMTRRRVRNDSSSAPAFAADTAPRTVAENTAAGADVGAAVTADEPDGDTLTYSLAGTSADLFEIGAGTGQITVGGGTVLNFEATPRYQVTVQVTDGEDSNGDPEPTPSIDDSISVTIEVGDLNEPPPAPDAPTVSAASSSSLDVGWTAPAETGDRPPVNDYDVEYRAASASGWTGHEFAGTGTSTTIPGLAGGTTYAVRVKANNDEGGSGWSAAGSGTTDLPDPTITISGGPAVTEGAAAVFTVTADRAPDAALTVNLSVADASGSDFVAPGDEGSKTVAINAGATAASYTVATVADETDEPNGDVTVTVAAGAGYAVGAAGSAGVRVNDDDGDANDPPVFTGQPSSASVDENSADGTAVLTVTATDPGDTLAYSLDGASDAVFDIDPATGAITVQVESGSALDHESAPSHAATVTATDSGGNTAAHGLTIRVNDVDEPPDAPTGVTVTGASPASVDVGWTAPAETGDRPPVDDYDVRYRPAGEAAWTDHPFAGAETGTTIADLTPGTGYEVQVRAGNAEGDSGWSAAGSGATDANNAPVFAGQPTTATVAENSADGTAVVTVAATDADAGDRVAYSLDSASDAVFDIDSEGAITVRVESGSALDHESTPSYAATVTATDLAGAAAAHEVAIEVADVAEPPDAPAAPTVAAASTSSVTASWTADSTGKPAITDFDVRYRLATAAGWTDHEFAGTGTSTTITGLAAGSTYEVQVRATNADGTGDWSAAGSGTTDSATNSAPTFASPPDALEVAENSAAGTVVGRVAATDADGDTLSFSLDAASAAVFGIDNAGNITVKADGTLDYETTPSYTVTVTVTDGTAQATHSLTINVTDVDETPATP
ncbi:MAG: hypothetical protein F4X56_00810, partial [Gammaproteobacteria bacterium]|nr:hypothetical protein [Gammaproteobacteria bacterium]